MVLLKLRRRLFVFQIFLLLIGACAVAYGALRTFERDLEPDMTRKGDLIARSLAAQIERALDAGIAYDRMRGVEDLFASIRSANSEIVFISVISRRSRRAYYDGRAAEGRYRAVAGCADPDVQPSEGVSGHHPAVRWNQYLVVPKSISVGGKPVGWVLVGIDATYVQQKISDIFYDILVVVAVSLLLTFELLLLLMASASAPTLALQALFTRGSIGELSAQADAQRWPSEVHRLAIGMKKVVEGLHGKYRTLGRRHPSQRRRCGAALRTEPCRCCAGRARARHRRQLRRHRRPADPGAGAHALVHLLPGRGAVAAVLSDLRAQPVPADRGDVPRDRRQPADHAVHAGGRLRAAAGRSLGGAASALGG